MSAHQTIPPDEANSINEELMLFQFKPYNAKPVYRPLAEHKVSNLLKNCFVGESAAKFVRSSSQIAGISRETPRFGDVELADFDRSQPA